MQQQRRCYVPIKGAARRGPGSFRPHASAEVGTFRQPLPHTLGERPVFQHEGSRWEVSGSRFSRPGHDSSLKIPKRSRSLARASGRGTAVAAVPEKARRTSDASRAPTCSRCSPQCSSMIVAPVHGSAGAGLWWRRIRRRHKETEVTSNRGQRRAGGAGTSPSIRRAVVAGMGTRRLKTSERRYTRVHVKGSALVPSQSSLMILEPLIFPLRRPSLSDGR